MSAKLIRGTIQNGEVLSMFENVLGTGEGGYSLPVIRAKFEAGCSHAARYRQLIELLHGSSLLRRFPDMKAPLAAHLELVSMQIRDSFDETELAALLEAAEAARAAAGAVVTTAEHYAAAPANVRAAFAKRVQMLRGCDFVTAALQTCNALTPHKRSLENETDLKDRFLLGSGLTFSPITGVHFNFKALYTHSAVDANDRRFLLGVLHKLYRITHDVYKVAVAPDVDISEFSSTMMEAIKGVSKSIPGCDQAFKKILDSVDLLQNNFEEYYESFVASNNSTIIMENFVLDVAKNSDTSPNVTMQFRKIISHYRTMSARSGDNPRMNALFSQIDNNFAALARAERAADAATDDPAEGGADMSPDALDAALAGGATSAAVTSTPRERRGRKKKRGAPKAGAAEPADDISDE